MKTFHKILLTLTIIMAGSAAFAQNNEEARALVKQGVQLNDEGKYAEAIEKYNQALKIDPADIYADYELAFSLFASNNGKEGIPHLEKVIKANTNLTAGAYDMLGSIYDQDHQPEKAIDAYKEGIKANPAYQRLYYNLGLTYFRNKQYAEAEKNAVEAIKLDPKHGSSQRMYALVTFHQNKRAAALLGLCSFILLEPNTLRSAEAYGNIQHVLQGGILKVDDSHTTITLSPKDDQETSTLNLGLSMVVLSGQSKKLTGMDLLEYELKGIFELAGELSEKKTDKGFYDNFYVAYFYKLAQSGNMPAFTRLVSSGANKAEYTKWADDHGKEVADLAAWVASTPREF